MAGTRYTQKMIAKIFVFQYVILYSKEKNLFLLFLTILITTFFRYEVTLPKVFSLT